MRPPTNPDHHNHSKCSLFVFGVLYSAVTAMDSVLLHVDGSCVYDVATLALAIVVVTEFIVAHVFSYFILFCQKFPLLDGIDEYTDRHWVVRNSWGQYEVA
jgi:hypothetical protein